MSGKLTKSRERVLSAIVAAGGKATPYKLGHPRSNMMHELVMAGWVSIEGQVNAWGEPRAIDGFYEITPAGRAALEPHHANP